MRVREALERLQDVVDDQPPRQRSTRVGHLTEVGALEQLHHDERQSVGASIDIHHPRDVLRLELRARTRLQQEA
jgi:hypothetical protein